MSSKRCYFMPLLRTGDLLFNAVVLQQQLVNKTSIQEALKAVRGSVGGMARDLFGHNVTQVSAHLLGDEAHADRLLRQHTMFGVFQHGLSETSLAKWSDDLKAGRHLSSLQTLGASPSDLGALSAPSLRSCALCIAADKDLQGFASWKLTHQVSAIDRCPEHGKLLAQEGRPIGGTHERIWPLQLPGESLDSRAPCSQLPASDGYAAYLALWRRVLSDELPWLKPAAWIRSMQAAVSQLGGIDAATATFEEDVVRAWGVPIREISAALFLDGRDSAIREELSLLSRPRDVARRMLLHGCLDRLGLDLVGADEGDQRALPFTAATRDSTAHENPSVNRLLALADQWGLPLASVKLPELDSSFTHVAQSLGLNVFSFRRFTATVDESILQELMESLQFSPRSWLGSEIARRRRQDGAASAPVALAAPA